VTRSDVNSQGSVGRAMARRFQVLHDAGPGPLWFRVLGETVYRRVAVMERPLDQSLPEVTPRVPVRIGLLAAHDLPRYGHFRPDLDPTSIQRRAEQGHRCFAVWHEGQIVHAGWAATHGAWIDYLGCAFQLEPGEVYQFDSYTAPAFRGLDLAAARVLWMARFFRDAGFGRLLAVVWPENAPAFRVLDKAGYRRRGWIRVLGRGRWRRVIYTRSRLR
jgi:RimJ/RimL family protein N-acetyltransferase